MSLCDQAPYIQSYGFSSGHRWMWELDYKESWAPKNWCFWTVVFEKTLESPLGCKEIKPVNCKGNQSWICIGRTDDEAETQIFWPPDSKSQLMGKDPDAGKDWGQEERGASEDEMIGWHHWLNGHEFDQAPGDTKGGKPSVLQSMRSQECTWLSDWMTATEHISDCPRAKDLGEGAGLQGQLKRWHLRLCANKRIYS